MAGLQKKHPLTAVLHVSPYARVARDIARTAMV